MTQPVTLVTRDATLDDLSAGDIAKINPDFTHDTDGISMLQYVLLHQKARDKFDFDGDNGRFSITERNAIRAVYGFTQIPRTIAEMQQAQRNVTKGPRPKRSVVYIAPAKPKHDRVTKARIIPMIAKNKRNIRAHNLVRDFVYMRDGGRCFYCHCDVERTGAHFDHVLPASRGGKATHSNLVLSCVKCNLHKSASVLENLIDILAEVQRRNRDYRG